MEKFYYNAGIALLLNYQYAQYQLLLDAIHHENQDDFTERFNTFTKKWIKEMPFEPATVPLNQSERLDKIYKALMAQARFFKPQRQPIKVQRYYDPSDDGQARVYSTLFPKISATLCGERRWFADYHAWREGRGNLFPELTAVLNGERHLFANLIATINRWIEEWSAWWNASNNVGFDEQSIVPQRTPFTAS